MANRVIYHYTVCKGRIDDRGWFVPEEIVWPDASIDDAAGQLRYYRACDNGIYGILPVEGVPKDLYDLFEHKLEHEASQNRERLRKLIGDKAVKVLDSLGKVE